MRTTILLLLLFCSKLCFGQVVEFNGNRFTLSDKDTVTILDPVTQGEYTIYGPKQPVKMNGEDLHVAYTGMGEIPEYKHKGKKSTKLITLVFDSLKSDLQQLGDGNYTPEIYDPVISREGKLVYYQFGGIKRVTADVNGVQTIKGQEGIHTLLYIAMTPEDTTIPAAIKANINKKALDILKHLPAMSCGTYIYKEVHTTGVLFAPGVTISVKRHRATLNNPYHFAL